MREVGENEVDPRNHGSQRSKMISSKEESCDAETVAMD